MGGATNETDANFFRLIHQLVGVPCEDGARERRSSYRSPFHSFHRIAPWDGSRFPKDSDFLVVRCYDLSRGGFSFLLPSEPESKQLVAEFSNSADVFYVAAEVAHTEPVLFFPPDRVQRACGLGITDAPPGCEMSTASLMLLVGCRFAKRLRKPGNRI